MKEGVRNCMALDLKPEIQFGLDNFQKPKVLDTKDSLAQLVVNLFLMRPGNMPSLPEAGIDINSYLYKKEADIDIEALKRKIYNQCSELFSYIQIGDVNVAITDYKGDSLLVVVLPLLASEETLLLAFKKDTSNNGVVFTYQFEAGQLFD